LHHEAIVNEHAFSLTRGGPFYHLLRRTHLVDATGKPRAMWLAAVAWIPLAVGMLIELAVTGELDAVSTDLSVHVRLLVTLPLLIAAENLLETRCAAVVHHAYEERLAHRASLEAIFGRANRVRDAWQPEALILVLVVAVGQVWLREWSGVQHGSATFVRAWCFMFAMPLVQFMLLHWLWRWVRWSFVLARLARVPLSLDALHPDRAAGLRIFAGPVDAFAMYLAALLSMVSAAWWEKITTTHVTLESLMPQFITLFVVAVVVACGPLLLFSRQLYRARHRDATACHGLARDYVDAFRAKWISQRPDEPLLGTSDIQSLADIGNSYRTAEDTRMYPFGVREIIILWCGAFIPLVPLLLATAPITELAKHLGKMMFGVGG
jgi:hypothetical protein